VQSTFTKPKSHNEKEKDIHNSNNASSKFSKYRRLLNTSTYNEAIGWSVADTGGGPPYYGFFHDESKSCQKPFRTNTNAKPSGRHGRQDCLCGKMGFYHGQEGP
jgi:hypothetical protein